MKERTRNNLLAAFAGESQAKNKYTFYAREARKAGLLKIAEIFEETAKNEEEHAKLIFKLLHDGNISKNEENLIAAIEGETFEYTKMYPEFEKMAVEDGDKDAASYFKLVQTVEKAHAKRFEDFLNKLKEGTLLKSDKKVVWKCRECGFIYEGTTPPEVCPLCHHPKEYYEMMEC